MKKKARLKQRELLRTPAPPPPVKAVELPFPQLSAEQHEKMLDGIAAEIPSVEVAIRQAIARCREIFSKYDPVILLSYLADQWAFGTFDPTTNEIEGGDDAFLEYALSVATATPLPISVEFPGLEIADELKDLIPKIHHWATQFHGFQNLKDKREDPAEQVRVRQMISSIYQRGHAHEHHQKSLLLGLFKEHDGFFIKNLGLTISGIASTAESIYTQPLKRGNQMRRERNEAIKTLDVLQRSDVKEALSGRKTFEQIIAILFEVPGFESEAPGLLEKIRAHSRNPYQISIESEQQRKLLPLFCIASGENEEFLKPEKSPCWPLNDSAVRHRPVFQIGESHFLFLPQMLWRNLDKILTRYIESTDAEYYSHGFLPQRGKWLEHESLQLLITALPGAIAYSSLYYDVVREGAPARMEIDGILVYDGHVIILSAKSGQISAPARRGALGRLKTVYDDLVGDGFTQIIETRKYILANPEGARFQTAKGESVTIKAPTAGRSFFPINVTLDDLGPISVQLEELRKAGILRVTELLWSVQLNDLRVIVEVIESPTIFLLYWQRRILAYSVPNFAPGEELDCFMYFLNHGLYFVGEIFQENERFVVDFTHDLDAYYAALELGEDARKPRLALDETTWEVIRGLEQSRDDGFTVVGMFTAGTSGAMQRFVADNLQALRVLHKKDGKPHQLTQLFTEFGVGINLACLAEGDQEGADKMLKFSFLKKYETKLTNWYTIVIEILHGAVARIRCHAGIFAWRQDPQMDYCVQLLRESRRNSGALGRNDLCWCNSGRKYKHCCEKAAG